MSYILEALKKSESERRQANSPPSIYAPKTHPEQEQERGPRFVLWGIFAGVFFLAVLTGGYLLYGKKIISITVTVPESETTGQTPTPSQQITTDEPDSVIHLEPAGRKVVVASTPPAEEVLLQPTPLTPATPNEMISESGYQPTVPHLKDLDPAFRDTVPDLQLAGHVYSEDAALRMILINNQVVRENDVIAKDYILEEITPDGIILRNGEIRFHMDAQ
ncbi:MAG: general secretion pathway protein GspB [Desulfocapsaceae bacterium]|nr:general secretion pathway protein GspB [Desulfocapsaceae bacterium]